MEENYTKIEEYTIDDFMNVIYKIEEIYTKKYNLGSIYVSDLMNTGVMMNTLFSDVKSLMGSEICTLSTSHSILMTIKIPYKKQIRSELKFPVNDCFMFIVRNIENGSFDYRFMKQKEQYIKDNFENWGGMNNHNCDNWDDFSTNAIIDLSVDKRFAKHPLPLYPEWEKTYKISANELICMIPDFKSSWGITYEWNGTTFVIPIEHENIKKIFKNREPIEGRKRVLPTVIEGRKATHIRAFDSIVEFEDRKFGFKIGMDDTEKIWDNTSKVIDKYEKNKYSYKFEKNKFYKRQFIKVTNI